MYKKPEHASNACLVLIRCFLVANARSGGGFPSARMTYRNRASFVTKVPCEVLRYSRWPGRPDELNASMIVLPAPVLDLNLI